MSQLIIPDMGSNGAAEIIEILVAVGDSVEIEQSTLVLESDKATIEVPADKAGKITQLLVKVGDQLSGGEAYAELEESAVVASEVSTQAEPESTTKAAEPKAAPQPEVAAKTEVQTPAPQLAAPVNTTAVKGEKDAQIVYAGPAVRLLARELGVDLQQVPGSGLKGRIQKQDVHEFVKQRLQTGTTAAAIPSVAAVDFSQFGEVYEEPLNNIKRATAKAMTIANLNVPQVTHFDEADITDLEAFRKLHNQQQAAAEIKFSLVPFVIKALARTLQLYPYFNSSLNSQGDGLIVKRYVHIGVAVDTPKGLLVPVLRDVDKKSVTELRQELHEKAELARQGRLSLADMQGASMTVSSLGGIGGKGFTPIVNPPEVAILGLSRANMQPVWQGQEFAARLMLPLSLSYDHRVIDGAEAARFSQTLVSYLQDIRNLLM